MMGLHPVKSTSIAAIGYERRRRWLLVQFRGRGRGMYRYRGVPPGEFAALEQAESKGRFVNYRIKPVYPVERIE
jgi:hypothetical protein